MTQLHFAKHVGVVALTLIALLALWAAGSAVAIFLASLAVAASLHPQVEYFKTRGWPSWAAAGLVAGGCFLVIGGLLLLLAPSLVADFKSLENDVSLAATSFADASPDHWLVRMTKTGSISDREQPPESPAAKFGQLLLAPLLGTASGLVQLSALFGICLALAFYWTLDRERFERLWLSLVPVRRRVGAQRMWQSLEREIGAYLRSEIIQFILAVVMLWCVFLLLEVRYAALAALVAGSLTLIPWLGTMFASGVVVILTSPKLVDWAAPWTSSQTWLALAAIVLIFCFLEFIVEPRLFQRDRYNPLWTAVAAIVMAATWGLWGLLFGPLVGYALQILVKQVYPRLVQVQPLVSSEATLEERVRALDARLQEQPEAPLELISLKNRLLELMEQRKTVEAV